MDSIKCEKCEKEINEKTKKCPNCGHKCKKENMIFFFIKMLMVFFIVDTIIALISSTIGLNILSNKYGQELVSEIIFAICIFLIIILRGKSYVFSQEKEKLSKSLILGLPLIIIAIANFFSYAEKINEINFGNLINLSLFCLSVGIAEEFLCRGWLLNEFLEKFRKNKRQIILSIVLSSSIFGLMHIGNVGVQGWFKTFLQILQTFSIGILFGSIYYRTKNIWSVVIIHAFYDFFVLFENVNAIKDYSTGIVTDEIIVSEIIFSITLSLFYIISSILILKKADFNNSDELKDKTTQKKNIFLKIIWTLLIIYIVLPFPGEESSGSLDETQIVYTYSERNIENYEKHYQYYEKYLMNYENYKFELYKDEESSKVAIKNVNTNEIIYLDFDKECDYEVIENENTFIIMIHCYNMTESKIYSITIKKTEISDEKNFLENIKESIKLYDVPKIEKIGYLTTVNFDYKYPLMTSQLQDDFFIDENGKLYLVENNN